MNFPEAKFLLEMSLHFDIAVRYEFILVRYEFILARYEFISARYEFNSGLNDIMTSRRKLITGGILWNVLLKSFSN